MNNNLKFACKTSEVRKVYASGKRITRAQIAHLVGTLDLSQPDGIKRIKHKHIV